MAASLIRSGTLARCPDVRVIVPHGGGTVPYLAPRMSQFLLRTGEQPPSEGAAEALAQLKSFYFDLTAATHPAAVAALRQLVPPAQILNGFDFPFMPAPSIGAALHDLQSSQLFSQSDRAALENGNALRLFPGFQKRLSA